MQVTCFSYSEKKEKQLDVYTEHTVQCVAMILRPHLPTRNLTEVAGR